MKNLPKCQEKMTIQQETYQIISTMKIIDIDLSKQTNTTTSQQTKITEILEKDGAATMFFIPEKQQKTILNFSLDSINVTEYKQWDIKKHVIF